MNTKFTLGQTVDLVCPSDPPVLVRSRIVGLTLDHAGTVRYNVKSVRKPEQGTLCDVPEASLRPIDEPPPAGHAGHAFKVGDVVSGVPGSALFGRGQLIVRSTDRKVAWPIEVATARTDRIPASPDELVPVPMDARADGHNPDGLTIRQVGPGYRLAPAGYVGPREFWHKLRRVWETSVAASSPADPKWTYRIVW